MGGIGVEEDTPCVCVARSTCVCVFCAASPPPWMDVSDGEAFLYDKFITISETEVHTTSFIP